MDGVQIMWVLVSVGILVYMVCKCTDNLKGA